MVTFPNDFIKKFTFKETCPTEILSFGNYDILVLLSVVWCLLSNMNNGYILLYNVEQKELAHIVCEVYRAEVVISMKFAQNTVCRTLQRFTRAVCADVRVCVCVCVCPLPLPWVRIHSAP